MEDMKEGMDSYAVMWTKRYMAIWNQGYESLPKVMGEEQAKVAACNTMMIAAKDSGVLKVPKEMVPDPKDAEANRKLQERLDEIKAGAIKPASERQPKKEEELTLSVKTKEPEKKEEAKAEKVAEAPKPTQKAPAPKQASLGEPDIPMGLDGQPMPAYDKDKPGWNYCPNCGSLDITHDKKLPKKGTYQACWDCRIWLDPAGGKVRGMDAQGKAEDD